MGGPLASFFDIVASLALSLFGGGSRLNRERFDSESDVEDR